MPALDVVAVIPAYQAATSVAAVVRGARAHCRRVLVVDDGSQDDTPHVAGAAGAEVIRHATNAGKGAALRTAFGVLGREGVGHALTLDADGQHLPTEIPTLLAAAAAAPEAIIVGVRRKAGHEIRWINRIGNEVADRLLRLIAGRTLPDTQSGFRVYPVATTLALGSHGMRFDFETEVLLRAARRGLVIVGVPVAVHYPPADVRVSHYRVGRDTLRIIGTVLRVLWERR